MQRERRLYYCTPKRQLVDHHVFHYIIIIFYTICAATHTMPSFYCRREFYHFHRKALVFRLYSTLCISCMTNVVLGRRNKNRNNNNLLALEYATALVLRSISDFYPYKLSCIILCILSDNNIRRSHWAREDLLLRYHVTTCGLKKKEKTTFTVY